MDTNVFTSTDVMGEEEEVVENLKLLNIIFIVDTSGSMGVTDRGDSYCRMDAVNNAFRDMIPLMVKLQEEHQSDFELKISIMTFDEDVKWIAESEPIGEYVFDRINYKEKKPTYYGKAFDELNERMKRADLMKHSGKIAAPYIMFMTDGLPMDDKTYPARLEALLQNGWFWSSKRIAVLMGSEAIKEPACKEAVKNFVSNVKEDIITVMKANEIAETLSACTLKTLNIMTKHAGLDFGKDSGTENNTEDSDNNSSVWGKVDTKREYL